MRMGQYEQHNNTNNSIGKGMYVLEPSNSLQTRVVDS